MTEWFVRRQIARPVDAAAMIGVVVATALLQFDVIFESGFRPFVVALLLSGSLGAVFLSLIGRGGMRQAFPPGLDAEAEMDVWRVVRAGGPVDDLAKAPVLVHHAGWRLRGPGPKVVAFVLGSFLILALVLTYICFSNDLPADGVVCLIFTGVLVSVIPVAARAMKYRRMAEVVYAQAHQLLIAGAVRRGDSQ